MNLKTGTFHTLAQLAATERNGDLIASGEIVEVCPVVRAATQAEPAPQQAEAPDDDLILIPRGLIGAACYAVRKLNPDSTLLPKLREYTTGSKSTYQPDAAEVRKQALDSERLDFVLEKQAFISQIDATMCQLMTQDEDEDFIALSGEGEAFRTPREAIDAARALSDKKGGDL